MATKNRTEYMREYRKVYNVKNRERINEYYRNYRANLRKEYESKNETFFRMYYDLIQIKEDLKNDIIQLEKDKRYIYSNIKIHGNMTMDDK